MPDNYNETSEYEAQEAWKFLQQELPIRFSAEQGEESPLNRLSTLIEHIQNGATGQLPGDLREIFDDGFAAWSKINTYLQSDPSNLDTLIGEEDTDRENRRRTVLEQMNFYRTAFEYYEDTVKLPRTTVDNPDVGENQNEPDMDSPGAGA